MSLSLNKVIIAGNLTRDPELKNVGASNSALVSFGVAVNRRYKGSDGEKKEETTFVEVNAWAKSAEFVAQYFRKGMPIYIEGRLTQESWEDKTTGKKQSKTRVTAENVQFVTSGKGEGGDTDSASAPKVTHRNVVPQGTAKDDDIEPPF